MISRGRGNMGEILRDEGSLPQGDFAKRFADLLARNWVDS